MNFEFKELGISDLIFIKSKRYKDKRGFFAELYRESYLESLGMNGNFVQDNMSFSKKDVIRGLHFQKKPMEQGKLVTVLSGRIYDVAVDIRKESKTFGEHIGVFLDSSSSELLYIPPGFAHGFCTLEDNTIIFYKNSKEYSIEHETGIIYDDPALGIDWPVSNPILSSKDSSYLRFNEVMKDS